MNKILIVALAVCFVSVHAFVVNRDPEQTEESITLEDLKKRTDTIYNDNIDEVNKLINYFDDKIEKCVKDFNDKLMEFGRFVHEMFVNYKKYAQGKHVMLRKHANDLVEKTWKDSHGEKNKVKEILDLIENERKILHHLNEVGKKKFTDQLAKEKKKFYNYIENTKKQLLEKFEKNEK